jgi:hypothetical protein
VTGWLAATPVEGAVYSPDEELIVPSAVPVMLHVGGALEEAQPVTSAENCRVACGDAISEVALPAELIDTVTGWRVTVAVPFDVETAELVAVTVASWMLVTDDGAVYSPLELMPPGLAVQVTAVLLFPLTEAENCAVWPALSVVLDGLTVTTVAVVKLALS